MGLGKYVLGGICAVGAVVAAPVVLPAAGFSIAASALGATGAGFALGTGMMAASTGAVATTAVAAGAAGVAVGSVHEKKVDGIRQEGRADGYIAASQEYEEKLTLLEQEFIRDKEKLKGERDKYEELLSEYVAYIKELEKEGSTEDVERVTRQYMELLKLQEN